MTRMKVLCPTPFALFVTLLFLYFSQLAAQPVKVEFQEQKLTAAELEQLFQQALAIFPSERLPLQYRVSRVEPLSTCATMIVAEVRRHFEQFSLDEQELLSRLLVRPILPLNYITPSSQFKIHYAVDGLDAVPPADQNGNTIPDFVEETAAAFDSSYEFEINRLGYRSPPDDAGVDGPECDVYIQSLMARIYGFTTGEGSVPGTQQDDRPSFIVIDNDFENGHFSTGLAGARVTAAHEFFHAIQFGYRIFIRDTEKFYYEQCSTWMEDVVYDHINDYYSYLPQFFRLRQIPFNAFDFFIRGINFINSYGQAVWNHMLVKKYNTSLVRRTWEIMQSNNLALHAINEALSEKGSSFENEFSEFAIWNYFTGSRADSVGFYEESRSYPEVRFNGDIILRADTTIVDSSLALTHKYYKFTAFSAGGYSITGSVDDPDNWRFGAIVTDPVGETAIHFFDLESGKNLGFVPQFSEIVVIPINLLILDGPDLPMLNFKYSRFTFNLVRTDPGNGQQLITSVSPNPFIIGQHRPVEFQFTAINPIDVEVRILSAGGRVIKTYKFTDGTGDFRSDENGWVFEWDGAEKNHQLVSSGIYIFQLKENNMVANKKFAVIRE